MNAAQVGAPSSLQREKRWQPFFPGGFFRTSAVGETSVRRKDVGRTNVDYNSPANHVAEATGFGITTRFVVVNLDRCEATASRTLS